MLSGRWLCSRCLGRTVRTVARAQRCFQSTSAASSEALISPVLLNRARSVAAEHSKLTAENAESYDTTTAKKIGELGPVTKALKDWEDAQSSLSELTSLLHDPTSDAELRSLARIDISHLRSTALPTLSSNLKSSLIPTHPFASLPCLIEIRPGAGGSEASIFAGELLTMYQTFCQRKSWPSSLASFSPDDSTPGSTGITDAILEISQPGSYNLLRSEAGVHRVQRVPATEKKGRTHTSAVSVLVLPSLPDNSGNADLDFDDPKSDYYIPPGDVRSETMRASGAGGQHVNKTDSAIRLTHIPTGIVVAMQESRSQHKNREKAWQILRAKLAQRKREEREAELVALRRGVMGGVGKTGREDKVRTYNYNQNRVSDHRCGWESADLPGVLAGTEALEAGMWRVREWMDENEVVALVAEEENKTNKS